MSIVVTTGELAAAAGEAYERIKEDSVLPPIKRLSELQLPQEPPLWLHLHAERLS